MSRQKYGFGIDSKPIYSHGIWFQLGHTNSKVQRNNRDILCIIPDASRKYKVDFECFGIYYDTLKPTDLFATAWLELIPVT